MSTEINNGTAVTHLKPQSGGGGIPEAPADGKQYARQDNNWSEVITTSPVVNTIPQGGMLPNVFYNLGELTQDITVTLTEGEEGIKNEYLLAFSIGKHTHNVSFSSDIVLDKKIEIYPEQYYQTRIIDKYAEVTVWDASEVKTNQIWYKSTDGEQVTGWAAAVNGYELVEIVNHEFNGEYWIVTFDQTVKTLRGTYDVKWHSVLSDNLLECRLPKSVNKISPGAFSDCINLDSLSLPIGLEEIDETTNTNLPVINGVRYAGTDETEIYAAIELVDKTLETVVIKDGTTILGGSSLEGEYKYLELPDGLLNINYSAIVSNNLIELTIPDTVTSIYDTSIQCKMAKTNFVVPVHLQEDTNYPFGVQLYDMEVNGVFIDIQDEEYIAKDFRLIQDIVIPSIVTGVDLYPEEDIRFPNIKSIATEGFIDYFHYDNPYSEHNNTFPDLESIELQSDGEFELSEQCFYGCKELKSAILPDGMSSIPYNAFSDCHKLESFVVPESVISIESYAFKNCYSLASITLNENLVYIYDGVFSGCQSLSQITIPDSVSNIGGNAFNGCFMSSDNFICPDELNPEDNDYWGCTIYDYITEDGLVIKDNTIIKVEDQDRTSYIIPSEVTHIDDGVFHRCLNLTSITIPSDIIWVGYSAFAECFSLNSITIEVTDGSNLSEDAFTGCYLTTDNFHCPSELNPEDYNYWGARIVDTRTDDGICIVGNTVIFVYTDNDDVIIPDGIDAIDFSDEYKPKYNNLICPDSITSISVPYSGTSLTLYSEIPPAIVNEDYWGGIIYVPEEYYDRYYEDYIEYIEDWESFELRVIQEN